MVQADTASYKSQAEAFYRKVTAEDFPDDRLIEACRTIYANMKAHPCAGWKPVLDRFQLYIIIEKGGDPDLMLAFVKDAGTGPIFGSSCLSRLFSSQNRDFPGIEAMRKEGCEAFLGNIPAYGKLSKIWDETACVYYYSEAIPAGLHARYGLEVTVNDYRIDDEDTGFSETQFMIVFNGEKYFY